MTRKPAISSRGLNFARSAGFTLLELMLVVALIAIISRVAYATYSRSVTKARRLTAEACLASYSSYMERYYATNLRYDQDVNGSAMTSTALAALNMPCANTTTGTGQYYTFSFSSGFPTQTAYTLQAAATGRQSTLDAQCGNLTLDQNGTRGISGTSTVAACWPQ